jgi:large subunit ribosomal protein L9
LERLIISSNRNFAGQHLENKMKVILLERIGQYGSIGDEVTVKDGFARNYLLPQGKALRATKANHDKFQSQREAIEKRNEERREEAAGIASGLNKHSLVMIRQAAETGQLYGSVSSRDISEALVTDGFNVLRSQVDLSTAIKSVGLHEVALNLHADVSIAVNINVARSPEEAERQATGEDLTIVSYDDEEEEIAEVSEEEEATEEDSEEEDTASQELENEDESNND